MSEAVERLAAPVVRTGEAADAREFEARLADSSTLAFRVAYSVLRQKQDAEDAAQEAFARAHRGFTALRDRVKFRAWLVRMTWRLALDHRRGEKRRTACEEVAAREAGRMAPDADVAGARERSEQLWAAIGFFRASNSRDLIVPSDVARRRDADRAQVAEAAVPTRSGPS